LRLNNTLKRGRAHSAGRRPRLVPRSTIWTSDHFAFLLDYDFMELRLNPAAHYTQSLF